MNSTSGPNARVPEIISAAGVASTQAGISQAMLIVALPPTPSAKPPSQLPLAPSSACSPPSAAASAMALQSSTCQQRYRWHLEKNATQMQAISWQLTIDSGDLMECR
eukprot:COSAG04_NODE_2645_length_3811_cov_1.433190_3_plen_107_part_00